jgi:hypothetical protein
MALRPRDLDDEIAKHFQGTPESRVLEALRLGQEMLDAFLATLPPGTSRLEAAEILSRNKNRGRTPSKLMEGPRH